MESVLGENIDVDGFERVGKNQGMTIDVNKWPKPNGMSEPPGFEIKSLFSLNQKKMERLMMNEMNW